MSDPFEEAARRFEDRVERLEAVAARLAVAQHRQGWLLAALGALLLLVLVVLR